MAPIDFSPGLAALGGGGTTIAQIKNHETDLHNFSWSCRIREHATHHSPESGHQGSTVKMASAGNPETEKGVGAAATAPLDYFSDEARPIDPDVAARVLRKIDLFLMPAMMIGMWNTLLEGEIKR